MVWAYMMILFLIEIYLLGWAIAAFFRERLPAFFLAFLSVLLGLMGYFMTVVVLTLCQASLSALFLAVLLGGEIVLLVLIKWLISGKVFFKIKIKSLWYLAGGFFFVIGSWVFSQSSLVFATIDSLYLVTMGRTILETGFIEWYFASPLKWGVFVPVLQTIGMLFKHDYTGFIQPIISITFLIIFAFVIYRSSNKNTSHKYIPYVLTFLGVGLLLSSNMYWAAQFYIHTNLDTAISLFITIIAIYFAIQDQEDSWLGIAGIFIIMLGLIRIENVILASLIIILTIATGKVAHKKLLWTFLPYLCFQIVFNLVIIQIDPVVFADRLSISQLRLVTVGLVALVIFLLISDHKLIQKKLLSKLNLVVVIGIGCLLLGVFLLKPEKIFLNTWDNLYAMFGTGQWFATFWGVVLLLFLVKAKKKNVMFKFLSILIYAFFSMIIILGYFKGSYHNAWYDSANRMYLHILPILVFYLSIKISSNYSLSEESELESDSQNNIGD